MLDTAYLVLENGMVFKGKYFGYKADVVGEIVFTTGMTGYLETLTDPSYYGQIVVQTFPLIGNYGVIQEDFESKKINVNAYIVKDWCQEPSNFRNEGAIDTFFKENKVTGLYGIDTRALTKVIREQGTMKGMITSNIDTVDKEKIDEYTVENPVSAVSTKQPYAVFPKEEEISFKVALIDYGLKENIKRELVKRGCEVYVFPYDATKREIMAVKPDGIMLSNGPGDPEVNVDAIETIKALLEERVPMFGICLGHQLLALAHGFKTAKLKYGHRGANQPVKDLTTNRVYITSQNHGYAVLEDSIDKKIAEVTFINVNDKTCEGIEYENEPIFSVQFHPEACAGPHDSSFLFDKFISRVACHKKNKIGKEIHYAIK